MKYSNDVGVKNISEYQHDYHLDIESDCRQMQIFTGNHLNTRFLDILAQDY